ncbi:MAG TPA: type II toxin-antitoxin system RelE/ParE family toxin [Gammaproteobacteria bacterium]|nr:type II toxin-antitoxin system RelE/ParE family toxin [Gammaproteobacteria bacterium]
MVFVELPLFQKHTAFTDEELRTIQNEIVVNPDCGALIAGTGGLRKLRAGFEGRGKRGGARGIYYVQVSLSVCYLLLAYPKNVQENLTPNQARQLKQLLDEVINNG